MKGLCHKTGGWPRGAVLGHGATLGPRGDVGHKQYKTNPPLVLGESFRRVLLVKLCMRFVNRIVINLDH